MFRLPAKLPPCPCAAELLVERIAPGPFAELGRDGVDWDDPRLNISLGKAPTEGARNAADWKPFDGGSNVARSCRGAFERQRVEACEVVAVDQRPAHGLALHHTHHPACLRFAGQTMKDATIPCVDHGGMDNDTGDVRCRQHAL